MLRFFDSRYKVSLAWDSNPRPSDFRSDALPTKLAGLTQGWSSTVDVYMRSDIEAHKLVLLADGQVRAPPEVTLYLSSNSTLAQCYLNFGSLHSSVASLTYIYFTYLCIYTYITSRHYVYIYKWS